MARYTLAGVALSAALLPVGMHSAIAADAPVAPAGNCRAENAGDAYPPSSAGLQISTTVVHRGETATVTGSGYARQGAQGAGGSVTLTLCSSPLALGSAVLTSEGTFSRSVTLPDNAALGNHHIYAMAADGKGGVLVQETDIRIEAPGVINAPGAPAASGGNSGGLAFTGADIAGAVGLGLVLVVAGSSMVLVSRRRRTV